MATLCTLMTIGGMWLLELPAPTANDTVQVYFQDGVQTCFVHQARARTIRAPAALSRAGRKIPRVVKAPLQKAPVTGLAAGQTPVIGSAEEKAERAYSEGREQQIKREIKSICKGC